MASEDERRFTVREGPPTWIIWDGLFQKQVNSWPYPDQEKARRQAESLNQTHTMSTSAY
jgi:hypothetical protein